MEQTGGTRQVGERCGGIDRRTLLKGAVAAGIGAAVYSAPVVSVVPAYAANTLVSFTVQSYVMCVWFSPNQSNFGQWHFDQAGFTPLANNWNPNIGAPPLGVGSNGSWTCWPPAMAVPVSVGGTTRWVTFSGVPDDIRLTPISTRCTDGTPASTVQGYSVLDAVVPWTGGGAKITIWDSNCELVLTGQALSGPGGTLLNLGPYCNSNQKTCTATNDTGPPATWAQGSSTSPIGTLSGQPTATLNQALTKGQNVTSLTVLPLTFAVSTGDALTIGTPSGTFQTVYALGPAAVGATSIPVVTFAASAGYAVGTPIIDSGQAPNGNVGGGVFKGSAYYHSGQVGRGENTRCKLALLFQVRCRS